MKLKLPLIALAACSFMGVHAYDFKADGLFFNKMADNKAQITYDVLENASYSGVIHIPATVENQGTTYAVTSIGDKAFYNSKITDINIPDNITSIGEFAFYFTETLKNITLPKNITKLSRYMLAGTGIGALAVPDKVTVIESGVLESCKSLHTLFLPQNLGTVQSYGFYACHALTEIYSLAETPPNATAFAVFQGLTTIDIIVPDASVDKYSATEPWNAFSIYPSEEFTMSMTVQGENEGDYDIISLGDSKAYKIYLGEELIAKTAADRYFLPNSGTPITYNIVPTNYFFDASPNSYTTKAKGGISGVETDDTSIYASHGNIFIQGDTEGKMVEIYSIYGQLLHRIVAEPMISPALASPAMYIVKMGDTVKKVIL